MSFIERLKKNVSKGLRRKDVGGSQGNQDGEASPSTSISGGVSSMPTEAHRSPNSPAVAVKSQSTEKGDGKSSSDQNNPPLKSPDTNAQSTTADAAVKSEGQQKVKEPNLQHDPNLSQNLWNDAYHQLEEDEKELVTAYEKILVKVLTDQKLKDLKENEATNNSNGGTRDFSDELKKFKDNVSAELKDKTKRQMHMKMLVDSGSKKAADASKITKAVGQVAGAILKAKPVIDLVTQAVPQAAPAALPWAGVCLGLQVSNDIVL